ncbi:MAG: RNA-guided pseudouridylation complex pseudouridine synthase subunit Cbf5 [Candidatus Woesearchaeota archaeon]
MVLNAEKDETLLPFEREQRQVIIKKEEKTNDEFGSYPELRPTEEIINYGIVNIDKPPGPTSHQVSAYVKEILKIKKAGHSGTLDPKVTGVLPVALGEATKANKIMLGAGKEYVALMHIHKQVDPEIIKKKLLSYVGKIKQIPPLRSAVKRTLREREIYYIKVLEIEEKDVLFKIGVEAGTYIRKFIFDFGKELGVGAHMLQLRRTKAGPFNEQTLFTLQDLKDAYYYYKEEQNDKFLRKIIQPVENAFLHLPKIWISDSAVDTICHGANLNIPGISKLNSGIKKGDIVAIFTLKNEIVAYGTSQLTTEEILSNEKGFAVKTERVFMKPNTYKIKK